MALSCGKRYNYGYNLEHLQCLLLHPNTLTGYMASKKALCLWYYDVVIAITLKGILWRLRTIKTRAKQMRVKKARFAEKCRVAHKIRYYCYIDRRFGRFYLCFHIL